jgi:hypothetical protein
VFLPPFWYVNVESEVREPTSLTMLEVVTRSRSSSITSVSQPYFEKGEDETHTPEMGTWKSTGTPKTSEFDCKGQNTLHWGILYIIGKVSKRRCRKLARMSHLDICSTSYGKKKGQESNW